MATMNPVLRLRRAFRSVAGPEPLSEEQADETAEEAADAVSEYGYSRRESDLRFERMMAELARQREEMLKEMAEMKMQVILAVFLAAGLIIGALGLIIALVD